jgi:hypothetical protein
VRAQEAYLPTRRDQKILWGAIRAVRDARAGGVRDDAGAAGAAPASARAEVLQSHDAVDATVCGVGGGTAAAIAGPEGGTRHSFAAAYFHDIAAPSIGEGGCGGEGASCSGGAGAAPAPRNAPAPSHSSHSAGACDGASSSSEGDVYGDIAIEAASDADEFGPEAAAAASGGGRRTARASAAAAAGPGGYEYGAAPAVRIDSRKRPAAGRVSWVRVRAVGAQCM